MTTLAIRKRLHSYLDVANDKKVKAIYALLEDDIADKTEISDHWNDPEFVAEMNSRAAEMESGNVKGSNWEEVYNKKHGIDSPAIPGKNLSMEQFKKWINDAEQTGAISFEDAKSIWSRKRSQLKGNMP